MSESYSKTSVIAPDGRVFQAGQTIRVALDAYSDAIILGFTAPDSKGAVYAKMARPHIMATCIGTTSPGAALMVETYELPLAYLMQSPTVDIHCRTNSGMASIDRPYSDEHLDLREVAAAA